MKRDQQLEQLKSTSHFDLLIIGGGATGCGVALDAASRGLKVALVEMNDFAEGTSSRSTKLVHGGVRYLEAAIKKLDRVQYNLVKDGLHERYTLLKNAPHLANRLPLVTPIYRWIDVPYVYAGLKLYDLLAGQRGIGHSQLLSRKEALRRFPTLKAAGLKAGVLYYDGQFHDARMALSLALTAAQEGATIANHVRVCELLKNDGKICGARLVDRINGESWHIAASGIINATGPFTDQIRGLDIPETAPILSASSGIHIVLDKSFAPPDTGLLIPETDDGRVLFVLPWEGHALVGTTDDPAKISEHPKAQEAQITYLLKHIGRYFNLQVERTDIKAVWSGLRPLVRDPTATDTAQLARDHVIEISASGLLTIAGGKWTTYRKMAEDTVNAALKQFRLNPAHKTCQTEQLPLVGGKDYRETIQQELQQNTAFSANIAAYLQRTYGDQAFQVAELATTDGGKLLCQGHPILEAEVVYAVRHEMAERVIDVLARRTPLALVDQAASRRVISQVAELMASELGWDNTRIEAEVTLVKERLNEAI